MDKRQKQEIRKVLEDQVRFECPMNQYTTFKVGGNAEALCTCEDMFRLEWLLSFVRRERIPSQVIGKGSNLLVKDEGVQGVLVRLGGKLATLEEEEAEPPILAAGGGASIVDVLAFCKDRGLGGLEFLAGIPGTAGGAVAMNAGAWGEQIGDLVREVLLITREGDTTSWDRSRLRFSYRSSNIPEGSVLVKTRLDLKRASPEGISRKVTEVLHRRKAGQPLEYPSAGSVFRNPPQDYAGRLIEEAGLKGERIGGAMISPKHANFIVNVGGASARDVLALINLARQRVLDRTGITLEPEIRVIG
jgi:UDP-N-acetylmuramate dehydrogenase